MICIWTKILSKRKQFHQSAEVLWEYFTVVNLGWIWITYFVLLFIQLNNCATSKDFLSRNCTHKWWKHDMHRYVISWTRKYFTSFVSTYLELNLQQMLKDSMKIFFQHQWLELLAEIHAAMIKTSILLNQFGIVYCQQLFTLFQALFASLRFIHAELYPFTRLRFRAIYWVDKQVFRIILL